MDTCPNEVLDLIFASACTDDRLTGRSLALVSKRIRDISRRYAFQSIALYGPHQISSFAYLLDKAILKDYTIRHLYLADRPRFWVEGRPDQDEKRDRAQWPGEPEDFADSVNTVAPTVETLTLLLFDKYDEQPLSAAISLPRLHELTVHGSSLTHFVWRGANLTRIPSPLPQCLSLRRLHVIFALGRPWTAAVSDLTSRRTSRTSGCRA
ncbi:hypothetical protein GSI_07595 [Ganoderma sinense ZZ0214-1]|uniref:F-box domain-containing protein n=1 Tax=Ganoderma sinense ZZ0214-1 TaxID=1077348 RepID=A0A2G8S9I1_9APHY|nr:hypothetical protein GSI_07595 [Ganoderma sinense ZZ0214-1]